MYYLIKDQEFWGKKKGYQVVEGLKLDEIMNRVRLDDEIIRRLQFDGGPEVGKTE